MAAASFFFPKSETSTPGVSTILTRPYIIVYSLLSLVKPASLSTMAICSPARQLNRVDLPELGSPTKDTLYTLELYSLSEDHSCSFYFRCECKFYTSVSERSINWDFFFMEQNNCPLVPRIHGGKTLVMILGILTILLIIIIIYHKYFNKQSNDKIIILYLDKKVPSKKFRHFLFFYFSLKIKWFFILMMEINILFTPN